MVCVWGGGGYRVSAIHDSCCLRRGVVPGVVRGILTTAAVARCSGTSAKLEGKKRFSTHSFPCNAIGLMFNLAEVGEATVPLAQAAVPLPQAARTRSHSHRPLSHSPSGCHRTHPAAATELTQRLPQISPSGCHKTHPAAATELTQRLPQNSPSVYHRTPTQRLPQNCGSRWVSSVVDAG